MTDVARLAIDVDSTKLASAESKLISFEAASERAGRSAEGLRKSVASAGTGASAAGSQMASLVRRVTALAGAAVSLRAAFRGAETYTGITNSLKAMGLSADQASTRLNQIAEIAKRSRAPLDGTAKLYTRISVAAKEIGASQSDVLKFTETVGKGLSAAGISANESSGALLQLSQAMAGGTVRAEEFNSILENAFPLAQAAARGIDEAGGSVGRLRQLVVDGSVSSKEFFDAILSQSEAINASFAATAPTVSQAVTVLTTSFTTLVGSLDEALGASSAVAEVILFVGENIESFAGIAAAAGVALAASYIPSMYASATATLAWAASLVTLRGALVATGIGALIVGAGLLLGEFVKLVRATGSFGNAMTLLGEVAVGVWEGIVTAAQGIPAGLESVWQSIKSGFLNMLSDMAIAWASFVGGLGRAATSVGLDDFAAKLGEAATTIVRTSARLADDASKASAAADKAGAAFRGAAVEGFAKANAALEKLRSVTVDTTGAVGDLASSMSDDSSGGGKKGATGAAKKLKKELTDAEKAAKEFAETIKGTLVGAVDNVARSFGDWVVRGFKDFKSFTTSIIDEFKNTLAELIKLSIANPIKIAIGLAPNAEGKFSGLFASLSRRAAGDFSDSLAGSSGSGGGLLGGVLGKVLGGGGGSGFFGGLGNALTGGLGGVFKIGANAAAAGGGLLASLGAAVPLIGAAAVAFGAFYKKPVTKTLSEGLYLILESMEDVTTESKSLADQLTFVGKTFRRTKTEGGFFGSKNSFDTSFGEGGAAGGALVQTFDSILRQSLLSAEVLGQSGARFGEYFADYVEKFGQFRLKFDLQGLDDEAAQAKIVSEISRILSDAVAFAGDDDALVSTLDKLKTGGEQANDTLIRVASQFQVIGGVLDAISSQSLGVGLAGAEAADALTKMFGSLEVFSSAADTFVANFFSDAEQLGIATKALRDTFAEFSLELPKTRAEYRRLVEAQDLTTDSGRELYAVLLQNAGAFADITPRVLELSAVLSGAFDIAGNAVREAIASASEAVRASEQAAQLWFRTAESLRGFVAELRGTSLGGASGANQLAFNQAAFNRAVEAAKGGDQAAAASLPQLGRTLLASAELTARSQLEFRRIAARVQSDTSLVGGISNLEGATDEVIADLYRQQITALEEFAVALENGTVTVDQLDITNARLGSLASAIADLEAFSYADLQERLRVTVDILPQADIPRYLRNLINNEAGAIQRQVDFLLRDQELTPDLLFLAVNQASEHEKLLRFVVNDRALDTRTKRLALETASTLRKQVRFIVSRDLTPRNKQLALAASSELTRTVGAVLASGADRRAIKLALGNVGDYAVAVTAALSGRVPDRVRALVFEQAGTYTAGVLAVLRTRRLGEAERRLILEQQGGFIVNITGALTRDGLTGRLRETILNTNTAGFRALTIAAVTDGLTADERELLTQRATRARRVIRAIVNPEGLSATGLLFLNQFGEDAVRVASRAIRGDVTGLDGLTPEQKFILQTTVGPLDRRISAKFTGLGDLGPRQAKLLADDLPKLDRVISPKITGIDDLTDQQKLVLTTGRLDDLTRNIVASVTVNRPRLLNKLERILGSADGSVSLTADVTFNPYAAFTSDIAAGFTDPMAQLKASIGDLKGAIQDETRSRELAQQIAARQVEGQRRLVAQQEAVARAEGNIAKFFEAAERFGVSLENDRGAPATIAVEDGRLVTDYSVIRGLPEALRDFKEFVFGSGLSDDIFKRSGLVNALTSLERARDQVRALGGIPSFYGGGYTGDRPRSGGLDGKGGFMAMLHPRETVIDHSKGNAGFEAIRAELAALRSEIRQVGLKTLEHEKRQTDILDRWNQIGLPAEQV